MPASMRHGGVTRAQVPALRLLTGVPAVIPAQAGIQKAPYRPRFGASARSTSASGVPLRSAMSAAWSGLILPTLK